MIQMPDEIQQVQWLTNIEEYGVVHRPLPSTCRVQIAHSFSVEQPTMPNRWHRFWQWTLLGWTWEKI